MKTSSYRLAASSSAAFSRFQLWPPSSAGYKVVGGEDEQAGWLVRFYALPCAHSSSPPSHQLLCCHHGKARQASRGGAAPTGLEEGAAAAARVAQPIIHKLDVQDAKAARVDLRLQAAALERARLRRADGWKHSLPASMG